MLDYMLEEPTYDILCPCCKDWLEITSEFEVFCHSCNECIEEPDFLEDNFEEEVI